MWLGPARRPFQPGTLPWKLAVVFDYGTGDLGNDGVHRLDYARWAAGVGIGSQGQTLPDLPRAVSSHGGKYYFDDARVAWHDDGDVRFRAGLPADVRDAGVERVSAARRAKGRRCAATEAM